MFSWINIRPEEEGLPRTPSLLPQLWVDAVGDTMETRMVCSSDVQSHRAGGENQEAPPRVWIQRDLEGLEKQLQIKKTQRRVKTTPLH